MVIASLAFSAKDAMFMLLFSVYPLKEKHNVLSYKKGSVQY